MKERINFNFRYQDFVSDNDDESVFVKSKDHEYTLGLGITNKCNFDCPICYFHAPGNMKSQEKFLDAEFITKLLDCLPVLKSVNLALEGEPFCHPDIFQIIESINERGIPVAISSNGSLLTRKMIDKLKKYDFFLFSLSIDSTDKDEFAIFRKGGSLDHFLRNASALANEIGDRLCFNTVVHNKNIHGLHDLPKLAASANVSNICLTQIREHELTLSNGFCKADLIKNIEYVKLLFEQAQKYKTKIFINENFADSMSMKMIKDIQCPNVFVYPLANSEFCSLLWQNASILSSGKLFACCGDLQPVQVESYDFDGIYNHPILRMLRKGFVKNKILPVCKSCTFNSQGDHNDQ